MLGEEGRALTTHRTVVYRVIVADDEGDFRHWLRSLLEGSPEFEVVGEAKTGIEALDLVSRLLPDVVITDVDMPDGDGVEVVRSLRAGRPGVKVIMVSGHTERGYERLAREEGALAFFPKAKLSLEALRRVLQEEG